MGRGGSHLPLVAGPAFAASFCAIAAPSVAYASQRQRISASGVKVKEGERPVRRRRRGGRSSPWTRGGRRSPRRTRRRCCPSCSRSHPTCTRPLFGHRPVRNAAGEPEPVRWSGRGAAAPCSSRCRSSGRRRRSCSGARAGWPRAGPPRTCLRSIVRCAVSLWERPAGSGRAARASSAARASRAVWGGAGRHARPVCFSFDPMPWKKNATGHVLRSPAHAFGTSIRTLGLFPRCVRPAQIDLRSLSHFSWAWPTPFAASCASATATSSPASTPAHSAAISGAACPESPLRWRKGSGRRSGYDAAPLCARASLHALPDHTRDAVFADFVIVGNPVATT